MSPILDSGNRRNFDTGAVRDISEDKGRCDLMPLEVVAKILGGPSTEDEILHDIAKFLKYGTAVYLYHALKEFAKVAYNGSEPTMFLEVAKHFSEGAKKYGENNWQKGLPPSCYMDSAVRHYLKYRRGDTDEEHGRAFVWNVMCCIWEVNHHAG